MPADPAWPISLVEKTKPLYESGRYSNAQIGHMVGKSRNAIIGKANRDGWINPNPKSGGTKPGDKRPRVRTTPFRFSVVQRPFIEQPLPETAHEYLLIPLRDLPENGCRFIPGDDHLYCGQPTRKDSDYCSHCFKIMYRVIIRPEHVALSQLGK